MIYNSFIVDPKQLPLKFFSLHFGGAKFWSNWNYQATSGIGGMKPCDYQDYLASNSELLEGGEDVCWTYVKGWWWWCQRTSKATSTVMQHLDLLAFYMPPLTKYAIIKVPFSRSVLWCNCSNYSGNMYLIHLTCFKFTQMISDVFLKFSQMCSNICWCFLHHSLVQQDGERLRRMNQIMAPARSFEFFRFDSVQCFSWCSVIFCCFRLEYTVPQGRNLITANDNRVSIINHWNGQDKIKIKKYCNSHATQASWDLNHQCWY